MATVPTNGAEKTMLGLAREKKYDNYHSTSAVTGPISLFDLFIGGNINGSGESYDPTNTLSPSYPKPVTESQYLQGIDMPMGMDEWSNYNHDAGVSCVNYTAITLYKQITPPDPPDCGQTTKGQTLYINTTNWQTATLLLRDNNGNCVNAFAGWYLCYNCGVTQGWEQRYWNGGSFTDNAGCL